MLTKKQKEDIENKIKLVETPWINMTAVRTAITLTEQAVIEEILKETWDVEPSLVRDYIKTQLKQKQENKNVKTNKLC